MINRYRDGRETKRSSKSARSYRISNADIHCENEHGEDTERGTAAYSISLRSVIAIITRNRGGSKRDWEGTSDARDRFDPPRFSPTFSSPFFSPISPPHFFFSLTTTTCFLPTKFGNLD